MPIIGLTTDAQTGAGLPQIARLYKGSEKPEDGKRPGKDLDYFRVEFEPQYEHLRAVWEEMYGEEPTEFEPVLLAAPTVDDAFSSWKEEWNASQTLIHRCDGQNQVKWYSQDNQMTMSSKKTCDAGNTDHPCGCKATGRLNLILPDFIAATGMLGYISVSTHSLYDILTVYRYLSDIQRMMGRLTGIPFVFGRAPKEISAPKQVKRGGGYANEGRIKVTKSLFYLHATQDFTQSTILPLLTTPPTLHSLPAPETPKTSTVDVEKAKQQLGSGSSATRRMGYVLDEDDVAEGEAVEDETPAESVIDFTAPMDGETQDFQIVGFVTKGGDGKKPFYALDAGLSGTVLTFSRDIFRHWKFSEDQIKGWDVPGKKMGFQKPLSISAKWKVDKDGESDGYWVAIVPKLQKAAGDEIPWE